MNTIEWLSGAQTDARYDPDADRQYVQSVIDSCTSANGVFGTTLHWHQVDDALRRIRSYLNKEGLPLQRALPMAFPNLTYIWMRRRDVVAQAVSWYRAICSQHWVSFGRATSGDAVAEIPFDFKKIQLLASILKCADAAWHRFFTEHAIRPYTLFYESFSREYENTIVNTLRYLEIDTSQIPIHPPRVQKMAGETSSQWVQRYKLLAGL